MLKIEPINVWARTAIQKLLTRIAAALGLHHRRLTVTERSMKSAILTSEADVTTLDQPVAMTVRCREVAAPEAGPPDILEINGRLLVAAPKTLK